ncbi:MAG: hypothetical protein AB4038_08475 [Prochloraceae cyanobacterium]
MRRNIQLQQCVTVALSAITLIVAQLEPLCASETDSRHWDYGGTWNPTRWGKLKPEFVHDWRRAFLPR